MGCLYFRFCAVSKGAKECRFRKMLKNAPALALRNVVTAENGRSEIWKFGPLRKFSSNSKQPEILKREPSVRAHPVDSFWRAISHSGVLFQAEQEVSDRLAPPMGHKPQRLLRSCGHELHIAALLLFAHRLHAPLHQVVEIEGIPAPKLTAEIEPDGQ